MQLVSYSDISTSTQRAAAIAAEEVSFDFTLQPKKPTIKHTVRPVKAIHIGLPRSTQAPINPSNRRLLSTAIAISSRPFRTPGFTLQSAIQSDTEASSTFGHENGAGFTVTAILNEGKVEVNIRHF